MSDPPALALRGVTKRFGTVLANDRVDLEVARGEVRAILGENGAGKSTLMRVLYGLEQPDAGEIRIAGVRKRLRSPQEAIAAGIGMVHQHFMLFPSLSVAENVVFGREPRQRFLGLLDRRAAGAAVAAHAERYGLAAEPDAAVATLAVGVRQRVEILKTLYRDAEVLILDEPTAVLTPAERDQLFAVLRGLAAAGRTILFITHKLDEVMAFADRATVLRRGRVVDTLEVAAGSAGATPERLCRLMVGSEKLPRVERTPLHRDAPSGPILEVTGLEVARAGRERVRGIDLTVRAGEIVGVAGVAGNGQRALVEALVGLAPASAGRVTLLGQDGKAEDVTAAPVAARRALGLAYVPEDRGERGLALAMSVADNLLLGAMDGAGSVFPRGVLSRRAAARHARALLERFGVEPADPARPANTLSGGNQQKVVLARELASVPRLLIAEQPTRGVDVAAAADVHRRLLAARDAGAAILLVSAELSELLALSDRILVMLEGRVVGVLDAADASEEKLGWLAAGGGAAA